MQEAKVTQKSSIDPSYIAIFPDRSFFFLRRVQVEKELVIFGMRKKTGDLAQK